MMTMTLQAMEEYALFNYEQGGHWVYECFGKGDYELFLEGANGDLEQAKADLKTHWELVEERSRECQWA